LKQNKFSSFDINIIDSKSNIKNEIQCIFLMNSNYNKLLEYWWVSVILSVPDIFLFIAIVSISLLFKG